MFIPQFPAGVRGAIEGRPGAATRSEFRPAVEKMVPAVRQAGMRPEADLLQSFANGQPGTANLPGHSHASLIAMAARSVEHAGLTESLHDMFRGVCLGNRPMEIPDLLTELIAMHTRGGVPTKYMLADAEADRLQSTLKEMGFLRGKVLTSEIEWRSDPEMPGVGHGRVIDFNPKTGDVVVPIYMRRGVFYGEHIHRGKEQVLFLLGRGSLSDATGQYATDASYKMPPGSIHRPCADGAVDVAFFGIAFGGVVMTRLPGTRGSELLTSMEIGAERLAALFDGIPSDNPKARDFPLSDFARYFFRTLDFYTDPTITEENQVMGPKEVQNWVDRTAALPAADRVALARMTT